MGLPAVPAQLRLDGEDHDGAPVNMARNAWHLNKAQVDFPDMHLLKIEEQALA